MTHTGRLGALLAAALLLALLPAVGGCFLKGSDEGSPDAPIDLTVGRTYYGGVGAYGASYYTFVAAGDVTHTIALTVTSSDLKWTLYDTSSFSGVPVYDCNTGSSGDERCTTLSNLTRGSSYYLKVSELAGSADSFNLLVSVP